MDCSTPGSPVLHYLLESAQTHVHWIGDAIKPCHPLLQASPALFPESGSFPISWLFASGGQSTRTSASTSVLSMNIQDWFSLALSVLISLYWLTLVNRLFNSLFYLYCTWPYILFFESRKVWLYSQHRNGSNTSYGQCPFFFSIFILYWSIVA